MPNRPLSLPSSAPVHTVSATDPRRQVLQARARTARLTDYLQTLDGQGRTRYVGINAVYRDRERVCIQTMDGTVHVFQPTQLTMVSRPLTGAPLTLTAPRPVAEVGLGATMVALMQAQPAPIGETAPALAALPAPRATRRRSGGAS